MGKSDIIEAVKTNTKEKLQEPPLYKVIYINDEVTTLEFVIESLVVIFNFERDVAEELAYKIHKDGSAVVVVLPYEMAEQKGVEVTVLARNNGFPLQIRLEPDL